MKLLLSCLLLFVLFLRESYWEQTCWLAKPLPTCMILSFLYAVYSACCLLRARFLLLLGLLFDPDDDDLFLQCYLTFTGLKGAISQKTELFITFTATTSNPALWLSVHWKYKGKLRLVLIQDQKGTMTGNITHNGYFKSH
jgi:hypothetical protein